MWDDRVCKLRGVTESFGFMVLMKSILIACTLVDIPAGMIEVGITQVGREQVDVAQDILEVDKALSTLKGSTHNTVKLVIICALPKDPPLSSLSLPIDFCSPLLTAILRL